MFFFFFFCFACKSVFMLTVHLPAWYWGWGGVLVRPKIGETQVVFHFHWVLMWIKLDKRDDLKHWGNLGKNKYFTYLSKNSKYRLSGKSSRVKALRWWSVHVVFHLVFLVKLKVCPQFKCFGWDKASGFIFSNWYGKALKVFSEVSVDDTLQLKSWKLNTKWHIRVWFMKT